MFESFDRSDCDCQKSSSGAELRMAAEALFGPERASPTAKDLTTYESQTAKDSTAYEVRIADLKGIKDHKDEGLDAADATLIFDKKVPNGAAIMVFELASGKIVKLDLVQNQGKNNTKGGPTDHLVASWSPVRDGFSADDLKDRPVKIYSREFPPDLWKPTPAENKSPIEGPVEFSKEGQKKVEIKEDVIGLPKLFFQYLENRDGSIVTVANGITFIVAKDNTLTVLRANGNVETYRPHERSLDDGGSTQFQYGKNAGFELVRKHRYAESESDRNQEFDTGVEINVGNIQLQTRLIPEHNASFVYKGPKPTYERSSPPPNVGSPEEPELPPAKRGRIL